MYLFTTIQSWELAKKWILQRNGLLPTGLAHKVSVIALKVIWFDQNTRPGFLKWKKGQQTQSEKMWFRQNYLLSDLIMDRRGTGQQQNIEE